MIEPSLKIHKIKKLDKQSEQQKLVCRTIYAELGVLLSLSVLCLFDLLRFEQLKRDTAWMTHRSYSTKKIN